MVLQCRNCLDKITTASWEGAFVNPVLTIRMIFSMPRWWFRILLAPLFLILATVAGVLIACWWLLKGVVYLTCLLRKCPSCESRRWGWPQTDTVAWP
jgi:hypothetical protein